MYVCVLNSDGTPLVPTNRCGKVRRMLKDGTAKVVMNNPFTIQLVEQKKEPIIHQLSLGLDEGYTTFGISVTDEKKVYYEAECTVRGGNLTVSGLMKSRSELRRSRRNRKTRYRKARYDNRRKVSIEERQESSSKKSKTRLHVYDTQTQKWYHGKDTRNRAAVKHDKDTSNKWVAPTPKAKIQAHISRVQRLCRVMPIQYLICEGAQFDTQLLKAIENGLAIPEGKDYQNGEMTGYDCVRDYVFYRDKHTCKCCKGSTGDKVLETHHIKWRKDGGTDRPSNLVTLCHTCHTGYHAGKVELPKTIQKSQKEFKAETFMGFARLYIYYALKNLYPEKDVKLTYGYITKRVRKTAGLPKEHYIDARCISGNPNAKSDGYVYIMRKQRCHNRQLRKALPISPLKDAKRKLRQAIEENDKVKIKKYKALIKKLNAEKQGNSSVTNHPHGIIVSTVSPYKILGVGLHDKVKYKGKTCFVISRNKKGAHGYFKLQTMDGEVLHSSAKLGTFKIIQSQNGWTTDLIKVV